MRKLFLFAVTATMMAACSNEELATQNKPGPQEQEDVAVNFDIYTNRATTRAGEAKEITTGTLQNGIHKEAGFGVFAFYTNNGSYDQYAKPNFMYNQQVTYASDKWTYEPVKYWPNEYGNAAVSDDVDKVSFFAYAPWVKTVPTTGTVDIGGVTDAAIIAQLQNYNITGMTTNNATGDPLIKYVVDWNPATSVDLLWGVVADNTYDPIIGSSSTNAPTLTVGRPFLDLIKAKTTNKIKFNLRHALTKLNIQIGTDVDAIQSDAGSYSGDLLSAKTKIYVRSVTFEGFATKGALNLNNTEANKPRWIDYAGGNELGTEAFTIYDGRKDGKEGLNGDDGAASNEKVIGLNPVIVQSKPYNDSPTAGVTNTAVNLFNSTEADTPIFVIPTGDPLKITIVYDVETIDANLAGYLADGVTNGSTIENKISKTVTVAFEAGKAYTIFLHLGMTSVKVDATVEEWPTASGSAVDLPENKN